MRILAHLAGDVPEMAAAELRAAFEAHGAALRVLRETPRFVDADVDLLYDDVRRVFERLGLCHLGARHLFDGAPAHWTDGARECCLPGGQTFAVRAVRVDESAPWRGPDVEREVGSLLSAQGAVVELRRPATVVRAFLLDDTVYVGEQLWDSDPKALRERHVEHRPFFSPVSLEPRLARALVNLARGAPGRTLYDPFCGTGGILLEAAALGLRVVGSDLDERMVEGSGANLAHFGFSGTLFPSHVRDAPARLRAHGVEAVDAIVTDLPYGRSATTGREKLGELYPKAFEAAARVLKPGGFAVVGMAEDRGAEAAAFGLRTVGRFAVRAHRSLTRHFVLLRRAEPPTESPSPGDGKPVTNTY